MADEAAGLPSPKKENARIRVFVDYWNFQLSLNRVEDGALHTINEARFKVDWRALGPWLTKKAAEIIRPPASYSFEGMNIYTSYNPQTAEGRGFKKWATTWLDRQPGIQVECRERKPRALPKCPVCHREIRNCPYDGCGKSIVATIEKGVDTLIATDMIRLAWEDAYDIAVLATSDSDLVPAVEFLDVKGLKVVQAGFPPTGVDLATKCWASFDVGASRSEIARHEK